MIARYHESARQEIIETTAYYGRIQPELGVEFLAELNAAIEKITRDPSTFEQVRPGIRRCLMERFPYGIYYRIPNADTVRIIIVRHHKQRPSLGMRRR
jgi:plasmid stabilization system protein ParE